MRTNFKTVATPLVTALALSLTLSACGPKESKTAGLSPQTMADSLHSVMEADRTVYTKLIVNRLQNEEKLIKASEHWKDDKGLVLPAQMFRYSAEMVAEKGANFSYSPEYRDIVLAHAEYVAANPGKNYYTEEELGGKKYFTAVYPDKGVAPACIACHNSHKDSPRTDFKLGDTMGGVVIRIPVGS